MTRQLRCFIADELVGHFDEAASGKIAFTYAEAWAEKEGAHPLSLSLPLVALHHSGREARNYLWNLLPDNAQTLEAWARRFQVSARNPMAVLEHVGRDCAGAIVLTSAEAPPTRGRVRWLTKHEVLARLAAEREAGAAATRPGGAFSLAGAQPKLALRYDAKGRRFGEPQGRQPTTHILKPATGAYDGLAENEAYCMRIAYHLGLPVPQVWVIGAKEDLPTIVIERYDRVTQGKTVARLHQEDFCQALGIAPEKKYQNEGGPNAAQMVTLLRDNSDRPEEDITVFVQALTLNWLLHGTDGHAKNYSLLHGAGPSVRLAPLYDIASFWPYNEVPPKQRKLALRVGGEYRPWRIGRAQWERFFRDARLPASRYLERVNAVIEGFTVAATNARDELADQGISHAAIDSIADEATAECERVRRSI